MAITGRTAQICFDRFVDHVRQLIAQTLDEHTYVAAVVPKGDGLHCDMQLGHFGANSVPFKSEIHGDVHLYMAQDLEAFKVGAEYQLKTRKYWYQIYEREPTLEDDPLFRWEYAPEDCGAHCRHHFHVGKYFKDSAQTSVSLPLGNSSLDLNKIHLPTRYVLIEDIIRFLIADLHVKPLCDNWDQVLREAEGKFFNDFSSKATFPPC